MPQNIRALIPPSVDGCVILLQWDQPVNVTTSFISHYIVDFESTMPVISPQSVAALNCNLNVTVGICAVDMCGRQGARADILLKDVLQDTGSVTECPSQTTAAPQPDASTCTCRLLNTTFLALNFVSTKLLIWHACGGTMTLYVMILMDSCGSSAYAKHAQCCYM